MSDVAVSTVYNKGKPFETREAAMCKKKHKPRLGHFIIFVLFIGLTIPGRLGCMEEDSGSPLSQPDIHLPVCDEEWTSTVSCRPFNAGGGGAANYWRPSRLFHADSIDAPAEIKKNKPFLVVLPQHETGNCGSAVQCTVWLDSSSRTVFLHPVIFWGYSPCPGIGMLSGKRAYCVVEGLRFPGDWEIRYTPEDEKAVEGWGELPRATITVLEN